ncbi:MAG: insulinase family protein [Gemmatimonadota bacterium]
MRSHLLLPLLLATLPVPVAAQAGGPLPVDPAVTVGTLANGLRYYIRENGRPENRAELRLVVNAGSILEDESQRGLAHFVEHMAFNGTRNFEKHELIEYLESIGMRFGADLNAYTAFDETVYMLQVPTDTAGPLETAMQILEDWAHGVTFDAAELDLERGVVVEEWRLGQGADERMRKQYFPVLFRNSRYAERLPIGEREVLLSFPREEAVRFYEDWYRPDLMAVVAVGDFDRDAVEALIRTHFSRLPAAAAPRPRIEYGVPDHAETRVAIATDAEATGTVVQVEWKQPSGEEGTYDAYRRDLLRGLFTSMLNARLAEIAQRPDPPFLGAGSAYGSLVRTRDTYTLGAAVQNGGVETGLTAVLTEGERVARHGFTATELERHSANLLRAYERAYAERDNSESAGHAAEYTRAYLDGEAIPGIAYEHALVQELLPGIAADEVNALAEQWVTDSSRVVVVMAPARADVALPTHESLLAVFDAVDSSRIDPYRDVVADAQLMAPPASGGRVVSEREVPGLAATLIELANGVEVYLMPTTHRDDEVLVSAWSPGGLSLVPDSLYPSGLFAGQLVQISGLADMDAVQLQKALAGKIARVSAGAAEHAEAMNGMASPRDLESLLQLIHLHFTAPRSDSSAYTSFMSRARASLANRDASPEVAFSDTFTATLWQHHPRARPQTVALLDEIDRAAASRIYRERFANAGDFTFAFVGAFEPAVLRPLLEQYLGSLPASQQEDEVRDTGLRTVRGVVEKTVRRGVEPKSQTRIAFTGPFEHSAAARTALAIMADVLDMRLRDVLREDMGGTYGVSIGESTYRVPAGRYVVSIAFGTAPERLDELTQAVFAEIEKLKQDGPDPTTLASVKEQQRRAWETGLQRNAFWLGVLMAEAETGEPAAASLQHLERVEAVTAADVRAAARRFLDLGNYVRVSLVPER